MEFYGRPMKYDEWLSNEAARDDLWMRRLKRLHQIRPTGSLLDIGAGIGQFLHYAMNMYFPVAGTEVSESAIRIARQRYELELLKGTVEEIEWGERKFDIITLFHVLEHVPDPLETVLSCRKLLNPNGILLITVPNEMKSISTKMRRLGRLFGIRGKNRGRMGLPKVDLEEVVTEINLSHFTPKVIQVFLRRCGFKIIENTLSPDFSASGGERLINEIHFMICSAIKAVFRKNLYGTIWIVAEREADL